MIQSVDKEYNNVFDRKFKFYYCILNPLGLWPSKKNLNFSHQNKFKTLLTISLLLFSIIPLTLKIIIEVEDPKMRLNMFGTLSFFILSMVQYLILLSNLTTLYRFTDDIRTSWNRTVNDKERQSMMKFYNNGLRQTMRSVFLMYLSTIFFFGMFPFSTNFVANTLPRDFACPTYTKIFDPKDLSTFRIVYVIQLIAGFVAFNIPCGFCCLAVLFITNVSAQLDIVMHKIKIFVLQFSESHNNSNKDLNKIFQQHSQMLRFVVQVEDVLNIVAFIEVCESTMHICFVGYFFLTEIENSQLLSTLTYISLGIAFVSQIFSFCSIGDDLECQCKSVGMTFWMTEWYVLPPKYAKSAIMLMRISNCSFKMKAGFFELSLMCFGNVIRTSLIYLNFFRETMD